MSDELQDRADALELAQAELDAFDRSWTGTWFSSKDSERLFLVGAVESARLAYIRARQAARRHAVPPDEPSERRVRRGRPPGPSLTREGIIDAYREMTKSAGRRAGRDEVADREGWPRSTLKDAVRHYKIEWPPE